MAIVQVALGQFRLSTTCRKKSAYSEVFKATGDLSIIASFLGDGPNNTTTAPTPQKAETPGRIPADVEGIDPGLTLYYAENTTVVIDQTSMGSGTESHSSRNFTWTRARGGPSLPSIGGLSSSLVRHVLGSRNPMPITCGLSAP